jgi:hypothetical protein
MDNESGVNVDAHPAVSVVVPTLIEDENLVLVRYATPA